MGIPCTPITTISKAVYNDNNMNVLTVMKADLLSRGCVSRETGLLLAQVGELPSWRNRTSRFGVSRRTKLTSLLTSVEAGMVGVMFDPETGLVWADGALDGDHQPPPQHDDRDLLHGLVAVLVKGGHTSKKSSLPLSKAGNLAFWQSWKAAHPSAKLGKVLASSAARDAGLITRGQRVWAQDDGAGPSTPGSSTRGTPSARALQEEAQAQGLPPPSLIQALQRPSTATTLRVVRAGDLEEHAPTLQALMDVRFLAVDVEGIGLSRTGPATWLVLCAMLHGAPVVIMVWIEATTVDEQVAAWVTSLLQTPDAGPTLLFWDVRNDADALTHQLGIRVEARRVLDVQLLNTLVTRARPVPNNRTVPYRLGMDRALEYVSEYSSIAHPFLLQLLGSKQEVKTVLAAWSTTHLGPGTPWSGVWGEVDLPQNAVDYAAFDVLAILFLFHELVAEGVVTRSQWNAIVRKSASDTDDFRTRDSPPRDGDTRLSSWKKW